MPHTYPTFQEAIDEVAKEKNSACKYFITDGITAIDALYGKHCGKLVETGEKGYPTTQGYIARLDWDINFVEEIRRETLRLAEIGSLESLNDVKLSKDQSCVMEESGPIDFNTMRMFFYCAYGAAALLLLHVLADRQPDPITDVENQDTSGDDGISTSDEEQQNTEALRSSARRRFG